MKLSNRTAQVAVLSSCLAFGLVLANVSPALAVTEHRLQVQADSLPPISPDGPSGTNPRQFMLNTLGKMLGPLTPNKWKREQIAYNQRYNFSWETLEKQFGTDPANPNYSGSPDSYQDYLLKKLETDKKGGTSGKPMTVPATKITAPQKIATGVFNGMSYIAAAETGFAIGKSFSRAIGMNPTGGLCDPGFNDLGVIALVTQTDCSQQGALSPDYQTALAANPSVSGGPACSADGSYCITMIGQAPADYGQGVHQIYCFHQAGTSYTGPHWYRAQIMTTSPAPNDWDMNLSGSEPRNGSTYPLARYACERVGIPLPSNYFDVTYDGFTVSSPIQYRIFDSQTGIASPSQQAQDASHAPSTVSCAITGDNGQTYTASTPTYTDSTGKTPDPVCPTLPDGVMPTHIATQANSAQGTKPIQSLDTTAEYQDWFTKYPECRTGACKLDLKRILDGKSCFDLAGVCNGWFQSPTKADEYQCTYGTHTDVGLDQCAVYSGTFDPSRLAAGAPYSDPMTGEWSGGANAPSPDKQAMAQGAQNPDTPRSCTGLDSMGFDPVAWVMRPVQCALEWAFVPSPAMLYSMQASVTQTFKDSTVGKLALALTTFNFTAPTAGCSGIAVQIPKPTNTGGFTLETRHFLSACAGDFFAPFAQPFSVFIGGAVCITGFFGVRKILGSLFGYGGAS